MCLTEKLRYRDIAAGDSSPAGRWHQVAYLRRLRNRLGAAGRLIHADVCFDESEELGRPTPAFQAHADIVEVSADSVRLELDAIPNLPVVSADRTRDLFAEVGLAEPQEIFRTLWYRCWVSAGAHT